MLNSTTRLFGAAALFVLLACSAVQAASPARLEEQLQLFLPGNTTTELAARSYANEQIQRLIEDLEREDRLGRRSTKKAIRYLRTRIEGNYLRHPRENADFADLFKTQEFNHTTTAAIYALVLEHFSIPYLIRTDLWEVYVIADPNGEKVELLSPLPRRRLAPREEAFMKDYLDLLRTLQIPEPAEWDRPEAEIFEKYYFGSGKTLTLAQLAGFLHYQQALAAYNRQAYDVALRQLEHANRLSARPVMAVLRRAALYQLAMQGEAGSRDALYYLFQLWREQPRDELRSEVLNRFVRVADESLFVERAPGRIDSLFGYMSTHLGEDAALKQQIGEIYCLKKARYHALMADTEGVFRYLDSLYRYRPNDPELQNVLAGLIVWSLRGRHDYQQGLQHLNSLETRYPFLRQHPYFKDLDLRYRAERIRVTFNAENAALGDQYLREFEMLLARYGPTPRDKSWILTAYVAASNYFARQQQYAYALQLLERAYKLCPGDPYLDHQISMFRRVVPTP